jgi:8-oxo-dGTP pyrophosphatase MutT (NUDIX family)
MSAADAGFHRVSERVVHQGHIWNVVVAEFTDPDGAPFRRDIGRSPGAVGVVPLVFDAEGNPSVVLVEQYRPSLERSVLEIPAGMRDVEGESTAEVARRELIEEAGLVAEVMELLTEIHPSPGLTDSLTSIYLATGCSAVQADRHGPEEERMVVHHVPLGDAVAMVVNGTISDSKTVAGLLLARHRLDIADGP